MMVRMRGRVRERRQLFPPGAVRLIVHTPSPLVLHHVALRVQLLLRHRGQQAPHAIRFQPQCQCQLIARHRLEVVRAIQPRRSIQRAAGALHQLEMLVRLDVGRALEEHVFEQVRESRAAFALVGTADVIPEVHRHQRGDVIFGIGDAQPVGQCLGLDRYLHMGCKIPLRVTGVPRSSYSRRGSRICQTLMIGGHPTNR